MYCFSLSYFVLQNNFQIQALGPGRGGRGAYIWRGDLTEGFLRYESGELIFGEAYFRNFTVCYGGFLAERSRLSHVSAVRFSSRSKVRPVPCELA